MSENGRRTAVITGGGRGIGEAVARSLAGAGVRVVVSARTEAEIAQVAGRIAGDGGEAVPIVCDVTNSESVRALSDEAVRVLGAVDILVNNAGIASSAPLKRQSVEEWERMMAVNATGVFLCTQAFIQPMAERGWGRVVTVASVAGRTGAPYVSAYSASKHAALGFTRSVAAEYAATGVTVNAVCPGYVDTPMTSSSLDRIEKLTGKNRDEALESLLKSAPHGRLVTPDEVASAVAWFCSDAAGSVNGQALVMDGGALLA